MMGSMTSSGKSLKSLTNAEKGQFERQKVFDMAYQLW